MFWQWGRWSEGTCVHDRVYWCSENKKVSIFWRWYPFWRDVLAVVNVWGRRRECTCVHDRVWRSTFITAKTDLKKWWRRRESNPRPQPSSVGYYVRSLRESTRNLCWDPQVKGVCDFNLVPLSSPSPTQQRVSGLAWSLRAQWRTQASDHRTAQTLIKQRERSACYCWHL